MQCHLSVRLGTLMHRSSIPLHKWTIAIYLGATSLLKDSVKHGQEWKPETPSQG